jgi:hypothetical protein
LELRGSSVNNDTFPLFRGIVFVQHFCLLVRSIEFFDPYSIIITIHNNIMTLSSQQLKTFARHAFDYNRSLEIVAVLSINRSMVNSLNIPRINGQVSIFIETKIVRLLLELQSEFGIRQ